MTPPPNAANAAPSWWAAETPPQTTGGRAEGEAGGDRAEDPAAERGECRAGLGGGEDPAEDDGRAGAEVLAAQRQRGRHGGHPVQAVEDDERAHAAGQVSSG